MPPPRSVSAGGDEDSASRSHLPAVPRSVVGSVYLLKHDTNEK
jgi:hypothetical protein